MIAILMIIYQWALIFCDIVHLIVVTNWLTLVTVYRTFFPVERKSVAGQIALVTGSGHGIGKELALQLSRLGAKVVCCDINEAWNTNTVEAIKAEAGVAWGYRCDVSDRNSIRDVMAMVRKEVGDVDILINNAGIMPCKPFLKYSPAEIEILFRINVFAHYWTLQEWLPVFMSRGTGHVVAISSLCGVMGTNNLVPYCSTKYAVTGLMDALKEELRFDNRYPGIKLSCVHPFIIDTGLAQKPRIRFPSVNPITPPSKAVEVIIEGMRRNEYSIWIPKNFFYTFKICSCSPLAVQHAITDFLDAEVDEHDD